MFLCSLLCSFIGLVSGYSPVSLTLNGKWSLTNSNGSVALAAEVPGCVHSALLQQGLIQDPYFRFNDVAYRWIALDNWTYTTTFTVSPNVRSKHKVLLVFEGVDTVASVQLNGVVVGDTDNMFRRYEFSVRELLRDGDNVLQVALNSPVFYARERRARSAYRIPPECPPDVQQGECHVNFIRKAQNSFSWDWGPSFPTLGLWKGVGLEAFDLLRLLQVSSVPLYDRGRSEWTLQVDLHVRAAQTTNGLVSVSVPELDSEETFPARFQPRNNKNSFVLHINKSREVKLWWPHTHGEQPSYQLRVQGLQEGGRLLLKENTKVFFRTVELVQEPIPDSPGLSFYFRINGEPIFLKGSNWIPAHSFQDRILGPDIRELLQSAADANMNTLRVWGGGIYEREEFYSICDELGIMIWQDMMFACALYPTDSSFLQTVREEVQQQVSRLRPHPSVIVWSGNNENEAALATDWFHVAPALRPAYVRDYVELYVNNVRAVVLKEDPSRPFLVSSPTNGAESEREGWVSSDPYDLHYGDTHFYSYWADCWDQDRFPRTRFASEYGFQSWPSLSTLRPVSSESDWTFSGSFSSHRQHHEDGNQQMLDQAALNFHLPNASDPTRRFTHTLYITQVMQAQCVKVQTEFYRRSRSEIINGTGGTMGALYWQLNDIWQAPSWSSIEFGGKWKMLHYFAQDFFSSVLPVGFEDDDSLVIYAVSDLMDELKLRAVVSVFSWSSLDPVCQLRSDLLPVPGGSAAPVFRRGVAALLAGCGRCSRASCVVTFHLEDGAGARVGPRNHHYLSSLRDARGIQRATITATVEPGPAWGPVVVSLRSDAVAPFVWLDAGNVPGRFSANGFLMVGANLTLTFRGGGPHCAQELRRALTVTSLTDVY